MIDQQTAGRYLVSPSGDVFTNPLFLFATCFPVKPIPVAPEIPLGGGRSAEVWISPDPARQYYSPYTYCGNNPIQCIDLNGAVGLSLQGGLNYAFPSSFQIASVQHVENLPHTTLNVAGKVNSGVSLAASAAAFIPPIAPEALAIAGATDALGVAIEVGKYAMDPSADNLNSLAINATLTAAGAGVAVRGEIMAGLGRVTTADVQRGQASSGILSQWVEFLFGTNDLVDSKNVGK